jgi:hypothetical protein
MKKIHERHLKLLRVQRWILNNISAGGSFSRACFTRVSGVEDLDSEEEVFRRRMGLRHYFKELKMNIQRIQKSKDAKAGIRNNEKKAAKKSPKKAPKEESKGEVTAKSALGGASPAEKEKKSKTSEKPTRSASKGPTGSN